MSLWTNCVRRTYGALLVGVAPLLALSCASPLVLYSRHGEAEGWRLSRGGPECQGAHKNGPAPPLKRKWKLGTGAAVVAAPVLTGGAVVVGNLAGQLVAADEQEGRKRGSHRIDGAVASSAAAAGPYLVVAAQGTRHTLRALDLRTGKVRWKRDLGDIAASPTVVGSRAYVGTEAGTLFAFGVERGDTLWTFSAGDQIHGAAAVCDTLLCVGSVDRFVYALSAETGRQIWKGDVGAAVYGTPALWGGRAFVGAADGTLCCLDLREGTTRWRFEAEGPIYSSAAVGNGRVYVGCDDGGVYAVSAETGQQLWRFGTGGAVRASPVIAGDVVYVGSADGVFYALDAETGEALWRYRTGGPIEGGAAVSDVGVYVGSTDRSVYAFGSK